MSNIYQGRLPAAQRSDQTRRHSSKVKKAGANGRPSIVCWQRERESALRKPWLYDNEPGRGLL